ncbi:unnamed protein product, partial [Mesorhabditis belari]|uniref:Uncharacterized protein n=1 Tax=Mesorhabditis belari TaxID=2138241 RepID=A0AAF3EUY5_9BILA
MKCLLFIILLLKIVFSFENEDELKVLEGKFPDSFELESYKFFKLLNDEEYETVRWVLETMKGVKCFKKLMNKSREKDEELYQRLSKLYPKYRKMEHSLTSEGKIYIKVVYLAARENLLNQNQTETAEWKILTNEQGDKMKKIFENLSDAAQENLLEELPVFTKFIKDDLYKKHRNFFDVYLDE